MYKVKNNLAPTIMKNVFPNREVSYNLRNMNPFQSRNVSTVYNGTETIAFRGPKTWFLCWLLLAACCGKLFQFAPTVNKEK